MISLTPSLIAGMALAPLALLLLSAAWSDIRTRRIPNAIVFPGACLGLLLNTLLPEGNGFTSALPGAVGFMKALFGLGIGLAIFLPFYVVRAMGAGDVKLMAMTGAFLGPNAAVESIVMVFLVGGALSVIFLLRKGLFGRLLQNLHEKIFHLFFRLTAPGIPKPAANATSVGRLPFATAIAAGTILYAVMARNGMLSSLQIISIT